MHLSKPWSHNIPEIPLYVMPALNTLFAMHGPLNILKRFVYRVWRLDYTGCSKKKGGGNARLSLYFDIRKYSIFWLHQIKHCLLKKKNYTTIIWFGSVVLISRPFFKYGHLWIILLNLREPFTAGIAVQCGNYP